MACSESVLGVVASAVDEIDRCLGWRNAGAAISGAGTPSFKHISTHEDPARFTIRVMIAPMVSELGYGDIRGPFPDKPVEACGSVVVSVGMNRPLDEELLIDAMRSKGCQKGIATDGFRWTLAVRDRGGLCLTRVDLRPYYVKALDMIRFRSAVPVDPGCAERFVSVFGRSGDERQVRVLRRGDPGHHAVLHVPVLRAAEGIQVQRRASLRRQTFSASLSTDSAMEAMNAS